MQGQEGSYDEFIWVEFMMTKLKEDQLIWRVLWWLNQKKIWHNRRLWYFCNNLIKRGFK